MNQNEIWRNEYSKKPVLITQVLDDYIVYIEADGRPYACHREEFEYDYTRVANIQELLEKFAWQS